MKQNQKILLSIGLGLVILLNVLLLGWLLTDFFSGPNGPEETVAATDSGEETTTTDEASMEEVTTEAPPVEQMVGKVAEGDAKKLIRAFEWGDGAEQLGYNGRSGSISYPDGFAVEDGVIYIYDDANDRVLICKDDQFRQIDLGAVIGRYGFRYQNGKIGVLGKSQGKDVLMLCKEDGSTMMTIDIPKHILNISSVQRIVEIGETYVVLDLLMNATRQVMEYRFDWVSGNVTSEPRREPLFFEKNKETEVIGVYENEVFYSRVEEEQGVKVIGRESEAYHLYTEINTELYCVESQNGGYLSADGRLYVMECFVDGVEISEIVLNEEAAEVPEETTQEDEGFTNETPPERLEKAYALEEVKTVVHTFSWGKEMGQLGYDADGRETIRPRGFAVEDGMIYVWDDANQRILICDNGQYSAIEVVGYFNGNSGMYYQNGRIGLLNESEYEGRIALYRSDGSMERVIEIPSAITKMAVLKTLLGIGDTYVVFEAQTIVSGMMGEYRYDWVTDSVERINDPRLPDSFVNYDEVDVIGFCDKGVYYKNLIRRENSIIPTIGLYTENYNLYAEIDRSNYRGGGVTTEWEYLSSDGHLYVMECFEDRVEISEITLTPEMLK